MTVVLVPSAAIAIEEALRTMVAGPGVGVVEGVKVGVGVGSGGTGVGGMAVGERGGKVAVGGGCGIAVAVGGTNVWVGVSVLGDADVVVGLTIVGVEVGCWVCVGSRVGLGVRVAVDGTAVGAVAVDVEVFSTITTLWWVGVSVT
jgi:hypothetical protein